MFALALAAAVLLPVHITALGQAPDGAHVVHLDAVTSVFRAQNRELTIQPPMKLPFGTGVDGYLDRSTSPWRLLNAGVAPRFTPGLPQAGKVQPIDVGSPLPHAQLVDQGGRLVDLARIAPGKVVLLSFIFTRCRDRDECPLLSGKFAQLQARLDPAHFHLIQITLDPVYDSPPVLAAYAARFGAKPEMWTILTGQGRIITMLLDRFGLSSLQVADDRFVHSDKVFVTTPAGKVADIVNTTQFSTGALAAEAEHVAGRASNPLGRLELTLIAGAVAICGGSQYAGIVLLETMLFLIIAGFSFVALRAIARILQRNA